MKSITLALILTISGVINAQTFDIDTKNAHVEFEFLHDATKGTLTNVFVQFKMDPENIGGGTINGSVNAATLNTNNRARDKHLKSNDFFDVENFPTLKFSCSSIYQEGEAYKAKGTLTIKGVEKEVIFNLENTNDQFEFKTFIYAIDFGVSPKKNREKSKVSVLVIVPKST